MRAALAMLLPLLAACGNEPDRGFAATAAGARQEPYIAVPPGSVPVTASERLRAVAPPGPSVTPELLRAGARLYRGKCAPCHGLDGQGGGPVVEKGFPRPPVLAASSPPQVVAVITEGTGEMPSLAGEVPPIERWAIAYYVAAGADRGQ